MEITDKQEIFNQLKSALAVYADRMQPQSANDRYELYTGKPVDILGRHFPTVYFAAVKINKGFVGFYYMPIYMNPALVADLPDRLKPLLKGKTCFHIKKLDEPLLQDITELLTRGFAAYQAKSWI